MTPFSTEQIDALVDVRAAFGDHLVVLIGASALQCHLPLSRQTADLDLTVVVEPKAVESTLVAHAFRRHTKIPYRFFHANGTRFDVLSTAPELLQKGEVAIDGDRTLSLRAFDLVVAHHIAVRLREGLELRVATVPVIAVLKMASYLDRPDEREHDLHDFASMLEGYLGEDDDRRFGSERLRANVDFRDQPAFALGIDIARIVNAEHRPLIETFIGQVEEGAARGHVSARVGFTGEDQEAVLDARMQALRRGLSWETA